jgi:hypothetical protein
LKIGVRLHKIQSVDMILQTCCALHNMLLKIDGLDQPWDGLWMPSSDYEGRLGELEYDDVPLAVQRLYSPDQIRNYDTSTIGADGEVEEGSHDEVNHGSDMVGEVDIDKVCIVRNLSLNYFCGRLVEHFDIKFKRGEVVWPRSQGGKPNSNADNTI